MFRSALVHATRAPVASTSSLASCPSSSFLSGVGAGSRLSSHLLPLPQVVAPFPQRRPIHTSLPSLQPYRLSYPPPCHLRHLSLRASTRARQSTIGAHCPSSSSAVLLRRAMGISSEDPEPTGRAAPGTPKWTVKRNAPSGIRVRRAFTPTGMGWSVRRETAKDQDNSLKQMFRDYLDLDWELKPLVWLFSLNVAIWAFYGMSELVVAAAMTSRDKTDGLARQAEHDYWTGNSYVSWNALKEGKLWTLLTNGVIHDRFFILLSDMIFMSMVGPQLVRSMGSTRAFIALCATSSVVGSISTACAMHYLGEDDKIAAGGSTVINGMLTYFALVKGASKLKVAVIPFSLSAWMIPAFYIPYIAWVDYNSRKNMTGRSQPGGELVAGVGGAVGGGLFFVARKLLKL